jgi:uncharacterized protein DUF433
MAGADRSTIEPGKMGGQPCIRGHRLTVEHLLTLVGAGHWSRSGPISRSSSPVISSKRPPTRPSLCGSTTCRCPARHEVPAELRTSPTGSARI